MRPIHSLIESKLLDRAQNIQSLTLSLRSRLSSELRRHCWVVDVIGNTLVIITDSAERATILRYQQHELLKQINEEFGHTFVTQIRRLRIKVDYNLSKIPDKNNQRKVRNDQDVMTAKHHCRRMMSVLTELDSD
jgi:hypothetical protein